MEENEKKEQNNPNFKTVQNPNTYKNIYKSEPHTKAKIGFTKSIFIPFLSRSSWMRSRTWYLLWYSFYSF